MEGTAIVRIGKGTMESGFTGEPEYSALHIRSMVDYNLTLRQFRETLGYTQVNFELYHSVFYKGDVLIEIRYLAFSPLSESVWYP